MIIIDVKEGESVDKALRRFKKKFEKLGILKQVRSRMYYTPPSVNRRNVIKRAARRQEYMLENDLI
jgi:small subunit ribosomal protein S21